MGAHRIFQNILYTKSTDFALIQSSLYNFSQITGFADAKAFISTDDKYLNVLLTDEMKVKFWYEIGLIHNSSISIVVC